MKWETCDSEWWESGRVLAGVDEAGRGALAGPVVAAAVILDPCCIPVGIADSKKLTALRRNELATAIQQSALAIGVGRVEAADIDAINILQATFRAMHHALNNLEPTVPDYVIVDGNRFKPWKVEHRCIVRGDAISVSIGAASIIAKTVRDDIMSSTIHTRYPLYGFHKHKGYGTEAHRLAIIQHGHCLEHRKTFLTRVVRERHS